MEYRFRQAHPPDIGQMVALLGELFAIEKDFKIDPAKQEAGLELFLKDTTYRSAWVATNEGEIVGMCTVQLVVSTAQGAYSAWVEDVIIKELHRRKGVARMLLQKAQDWSFHAGATRMQLLADMGNPDAYSFYEGNGWNRTSMQCLRHMI